jgi:hypothetical protein
MAFLIWTSAIEWKDPKVFGNDCLRTDKVIIIAEHLEPDVEWTVLTTNIELKDAQSNASNPQEPGAIEASSSAAASTAEETRRQFELSRGLVCCVINDVNNGIPRNDVAANECRSAHLLARLSDHHPLIAIFVFGRRWCHRISAICIARGVWSVLTSIFT